MGKRISQLAEITTVDSDDLLVVVDKSDTSMADSGTDKKVQKVNLLKGLVPENGWIPAGETWTYASADDPTYTFTVAADVTTKYSVGMKIKLTQGTVKYFIITAISTYSGGNTTITVYGGTDYDLADSAISANAYSMMRTPVGFPMSPAKWSVETTSSSVLSQNPATKDVWYNKLSIILPIGSWSLMYKITLEAYVEGATQVIGMSTLSTANNSESDSQLTASVGLTSMWIGVSVGKEKFLSLSSKTTYYLNILNTGAGSPSLRIITINGAYSPSVIRATCAYL